MLAKTSFCLRENGIFKGRRSTGKDKEMGFGRSDALAPP